MKPGTFKKSLKDTRQLKKSIPNSNLNFQIVKKNAFGQVPDTGSEGGGEGVGFSSQDHGRLSIVHCFVWCGMCGVRVLYVYVYVYVYVVCCVLLLWCVRCVVVLWCSVGVVLWCFVWCGAAWHAENSSVCRFETPLFVRSRRLRVYPVNARMFNTCGRFPGTHGGVLNAHTEAF